jgi:hypothetical protein
LPGFGVVIGGSCDQGSDEGAEQSLSASPGVVDELEEAQVGGQLLLRDPAMRTAPKGRNGGALNENHKHGLYSASLSPAEKEVWDDISLDSLDDEIRMTRIWLARAGALDYEIGKDPASTKNLTGFELTEITKSRKGDGGKEDTAITSKRPDLWARKDRLLGRLAHLVKIRAELIAAAQAAGEGAGDVARDLVDTLRAMRRTEFEQPMPEPEPTPFLHDIPEKQGGE